MLVDLAGLDEQTLDGVIKEFRNGWQKQKVEARAAQKRLGQSNQKEHRGVDGLGKLKAQISSDSYHYWGQRLGYQCWQDKAFMDQYLKQNPQCKTQGGATKLQVGYAPTKVKYRKVYNADA